MKMLRSSDLPKLLMAQPGPCLSMYVNTDSLSHPSHGTRRKWDEAIEQADSLIKDKHSRHRARFLLEPLRSMPEILSQPPPHAKGVALFRSFTTAGYFPIEEPTRSVMAVSDTFHLKPLLKRIQKQERYFALALNQRQISLYRGGRSGAKLMARYQADYGDALVQRGARRKPRGNKVTVPRGKSARNAVVHFRPLTRVSRFMERAEPHLWKRLKGASHPLVLLGTPFMHRLYRNMNCYPHVSPESVSASVPHQASVIHERAWPIAERHLWERERRLIDKFYEARSREQASDEPDVIARACIKGRISTLLICKDASLFGLLDRDQGRILPAEPGGGSFGGDVLDDIAQEVIVRKGTVHVLEPDAMPESCAIAAVFRW